MLYKSIIFVTLYVAVIVTTAYDFQDEAFNEILARDLNELTTQEETRINYRNRRDEEAVNSGGSGDKCRRRRFKGCCADEIFENVHERDRPIKKECFKQITGNDHVSPPDPFKCDKSEGHRKNMTCVVQCIFEKRNDLDSDGNIKEENFAKNMKEAFKSEEWFVKLFEKILPKCLEEAKKAGNERDTKDKNSCNPSSIKMVHCIFREIQLGCPPEQIKDEKACTRLREKLLKNDFYGSQPPQQMEDE